MDELDLMIKHNIPVLKEQQTLKQRALLFGQKAMPKAKSKEM